MEEIKLYKTTKRGLKIIGMSIPFVVIGIWMITQEQYGTTNYIMGWFGTCFFGLGIPIGLFQAFDKRPQIIINENGIWDRTTNQDEIKWEQIIEAYPLDIHEQNFICLVTDDTFVFKKKPYKWAAKINEFVGAQNLNLSLGQINVDVCDLTNLVNELSKSEKKERKNIIQSFKVNTTNFSISDLQKVLYVFISIALLLLSLTGITAFMTIMIVMGVAAVIARWRPDNFKLRKYAGIVTWFGVVNMVLFFLTIKLYDYTTENVGLKITTQIESYHDKFETYPENIELLKKDINSNFIQRHFADKIQYKTTENNFELQLNTLFNHDKKYNKQLNEWE
jgi:hypothetical protein